MYLNETEEYKEELALLIEEFLHQRILGFKNKRGVYIAPAFPKYLYVLEEDNITPDSKFWYLTELAAECVAKRMVPDFISEKIMLELKGDCYPCMGCRSFLTPDRSRNGFDNIAKADNYDGKPKYYGRFNQGVVTINLVDVALSSKGDFEKFEDILEDRLEICHRALQLRHERLAGATSDVAPILWQHGALARLAPGENLHKLLHNNYSTISLGYAGLYECVKYMTSESHTSKDGKKFGLHVMQRLNDKCAEWRDQEAIDYSVYGSPIESTTYKFASCLKKRFGEIEGITDRDYITNSYHIPVFEKINAFDKLKIESEFQALSPGGAISYVELPDMKKNTEAIISIIQYIYDNIMYAEINLHIDYCMKCGYDGDIKLDSDLEWYCPNCGNRDKNEMSVTRRTCGYLGANFWNYGRTQEIAERVYHLGAE
jgi:ribonucleoside-triphosphate reductase